MIHCGRSRYEHIPGRFSAKVATIFIYSCDTFMMASTSLPTSATTSSTKKRSSMQAMRPPPSPHHCQNLSSSTIQFSPKIKDASVDDTIGFRDDLLTHILAETAAAAKVQLTEMEKKPKEEEEDQLGNRQLDNYSFSSTECSLFLLGCCQDRHFVVVGDEITISSKQQQSLNITFTLNHWVHFVAMLKDINTKVLIIECIQFHFEDTWATATM